MTWGKGKVKGEWALKEKGEREKEGGGEGRC